MVRWSGGKDKESALPELLSSPVQFCCALLTNVATRCMYRGAGTTSPGGGPRHLAVHPSAPVVSQ
jgi:hypothetical protein